eukprot:364815-Chlamydomonas_euryale.AAC.6
MALTVVQEHGKGGGCPKLSGTAPSCQVLGYDVMQRGMCNVYMHAHVCACGHEGVHACECVAYTQASMDACSQACMRMHLQSCSRHTQRHAYLVGVACGLNRIGTVERAVLKWHVHEVAADNGGQRSNTLLRALSQTGGSGGGGAPV